MKNLNSSKIISVYSMHSLCVKLLIYLFIHHKLQLFIFLTTGSKCFFSFAISTFYSLLIISFSFNSFSLSGSFLQASFSRAVETIKLFWLGGRLGKFMYFSCATCAAK